MQSFSTTITQVILNFDKTKLDCFKINLCIKLSVPISEINNKGIENVDKIKFLGFIVVSNLFKDFIRVLSVGAFLKKSDQI